MDPLELPECPVCLQPFDGDPTTPRVLACGHSVCETCLMELPKPFPRTVRCPACTQLVNYPHPQGPSALPKNIDLLRISSLLINPNHKNSQKPLKPKKQSSHEFIPDLWSYDFYSSWKDWIVPKDAFLVESSVDDYGFCLYGRIRSSDGSSVSAIRYLLKDNQKVSLLKVGSFSNGTDLKFNYSYVARIMQVLFGMRDGERAELCLILRASLKEYRICKVYGLCYNEYAEGVYLVSERYNSSFLNNLKYGSVSVEEEKLNSGIEDNISGFWMIFMEICEAVSGLRKGGLVSGCLALSCFGINNFGHVFIDLSEILVIGGRIQRILTKAVSRARIIENKELEMSLKDEILELHAFISPELLLEFLHKEGIDLGSGSSRYAVGYDSDVWPLACILLWLIAGEPFVEETNKNLCCIILSAIDKNGYDFEGLYMGWLEKVSSLLNTRLGLEFGSVNEFLCRCLNFDPKRRPLVTDLWKCIRELFIKPQFDSLDQEITNEDTGHCLLLGELFQLLKSTNKVTERMMANYLQEEDENGRIDIDKVEELMGERDLIEGLSGGPLKCIDLKGHLDCITGLAIGGGFLFSSSFDKTVHVWSLQDFTHLHAFKGHEHRVTAVVFVDEEQPLCISADSGGGICVWGIKVPFKEEPIKRLYEHKDWRYSGIHALAISGTGYFYTGSGDKLIKAWSMQDYTLSCTMTGHKSVVSTLAVCNGVLHSGSWDGTIRLWCLSDHSPLIVLGEDMPGNLTSGSVLSLAADRHTLIAAYEIGCIKIWSNDVLLKSTSAHIGAIFTVSMEGKWLFSGGWNKTVIVQELSGDESQKDAIQIGSIACDSVITALLYWQGKLFIGQADRIIKVYYCGV